MANKILGVLILLIIATSSYGQNAREDLTEQYHENVIGITKNGLLEGQVKMVDYLMGLYNKKGQLVNYKKEFNIPVYEVLSYEIGTSQTKDNSEHAHLIIWENKSNKKIAEAIYQKPGLTDIPEALTTARQKWMTLCNLNNAKTLIEELYTKDVIYYNRGRILRGHEQLSTEYSYMNNPTYKLQLNPKHIERVSEDIIFEIGLCSGSYNLPYMLIWKKQPDDSWKIYFDSNY